VDLASGLRAACGCPVPGVRRRWAAV